MKNLKLLLLTAIAVLISSCVTLVHEGSHSRLPVKDIVVVLMPPFRNATTYENAGIAVRETVGSAFYKHGVKLYQTEKDILENEKKGAAGIDGVYSAVVKTNPDVTHLLIGTVHEYKYKTDLNGDPVVGFTLRLVDPKTGATQWQGTASHTGVGFSSLSSITQHASNKIVYGIPWGE